MNFKKLFIIIEMLFFHCSNPIAPEIKPVITIYEIISISPPIQKSSTYVMPLKIKLINYGLDENFQVQVEVLKINNDINIEKLWINTYKNELVFWIDDILLFKEITITDLMLTGAIVYHKTRFYHQFIALKKDKKRFGSRIRY